MDRTERTKLAEVIRERYQGSSKADKSKILNEFVAITGLHRKYAIHVLRDVE